MRRRAESGESLIEIMFAVVIIGLVVSAIFATYATVTRSSKSQRDIVTADTVLRNAAERTKRAVRDDCSAGSTYSVAYSAPPGFTPPATVTNPCPPVIGAIAAQVPTITLIVTMPDGNDKSLDLMVRKPGVSCPDESGATNAGRPSSSRSRS